MQWAQSRIKERIIEHAHKDLIAAGPCLFCEHPIQYLISEFHRRYRDEWFLKLQRTIIRPYRLDIKYYGGSRIDIWLHRSPENAGTIKWESIRGYVCQTCTAAICNEVYSVIESTKKNLKRKEAIATKKADEEQALRELRRTMPYLDFLKSEYWAQVRAKALRSAQYQCQLCKETKNLHVHHKSYGNRGDELNHMDDLIVLCSSCHETFHHGKRAFSKNQVGMPSAFEVIQ